MILLFVPETKGLTLEQLDEVFNIKTSEHMAHGMEELRWFFSTYILRQVRRKPVLLTFEENEPRYVDPKELRSFEEVPMGGWEPDRSRSRSMDMRSSAEASGVVGRDEGRFDRITSRESRVDRQSWDRRAERTYSRDSRVGRVTSRDP